MLRRRWTLHSAEPMAGGPTRVEDWGGTAVAVPAPGQLQRL